MKTSESDHLHRLVHAMTRAEKRYFKLYTSRHTLPGMNVLQVLFDAIAAMPSYDVSLLRRQFAGQAFMRRFAITKRRLYETLLESLDAFHANGSIDDQLRRKLHQVEILHHKTLHHDAAKLLRSASALASAHDRQAMQLQVIEWERRLWERTNYTGLTSSTMHDRAQRAERSAAAWLEVDKLWQLKSETFLVMFRSGQSPGPKELDQLNSIEEQILLAQENDLLSPRSRFLYHHVRSALAYARNDLATCEKQLATCIQVLQAEPRSFDGEPELILGVMGNLAQVRLRLGHYQQALDGFRDFRRYPLIMSKAPDQDLEMKLFVMDSSLQLAVQAVQGAFMLSLELMPTIEDGMTRYGERISTVRRSELALQAAYACLGAGRPDSALRWCNRLLNEKGITNHLELHALGRMLNVMCLVELGKADLLGYLVRNAQRALKQHDSPFKMEYVLLAHAQALAATSGIQRGRPLWLALASALQRVAADPKEATVLDQIDLVVWVKAKLEGRRMSEILQDRWLAQAPCTGPVAKSRGGNKAA